MGSGQKIFGGTDFCEGHAAEKVFLAQTKATPAHFAELEVTPWDQGSQLSSATMIPQMTVVADLTRSED